MLYLIDLLLFSLHMRAVKKQYHQDDRIQGTQLYQCTCSTEETDVELDDARRENDEMFLHVIAVGNGVKELFTSQEAIAMSLLASRYESGYYQPEQ